MRKRTKEEDYIFLGEGEGEEKKGVVARRANVGTMKERGTGVEGGGDKRSRGQDTNYI